MGLDYRSVLNGFADAVIAADEHGMIVFANAAAERLLGWDDGGLVGQPLVAIQPERLRDAHRGGFKRYLDTRVPRLLGRPVRVPALRRDGAEVDVELVISAHPLDGQGELFVAALRDLRDRVELERQLAEADTALVRTHRDNQALERSNADLEQFAYAASHDLREPLRAVAGYAQLLRARYGGQLDEDAHEYMAFMVDGAERLQVLTDALLEYSRVDNEPLGRASVDLAKLAAQVLELLVAPISEHDARVDVGPLPSIGGEEAQLQRVLQNLVSNAVKFTEPGRIPEVEVTASHDPGAWRISVADRGIGIDPARADQVFQMFKRLHSRHDYPGTGIGLSLCRRIVERHGGRIWFEPRPGGGTVFHFTIPDCPEAVARS
jgi:PAS domain S-box-containing protein